MTVRRVSSKHECILVGPQREDRRVGEEGVPKAETAHRFGVDRATVKRYCKQLDERGSLEPRKAPSNKPKLDEQARRLFVEDLRQRPWATHSQRAELLFAACGVSVSEATICRTLRRLSHSRKKIPRDTRTRRVLEAPVARGGRSPRSLWPGVLKDQMGTHTSLAPIYAYSPVGEQEDYERLCEASQAMIYAVMTRLMLRRLTRARPFSHSS